MRHQRIRISRGGQKVLGREPTPRHNKAERLCDAVIRFEAGTVGKGTPWGAGVAELRLAPSWERILMRLVPLGRLRPVQTSALRETQLLSSRRNIVVSAPTNSGKSLVGTLAILEALLKGKRAVLVEPLRALAQEKADELSAVLAKLPRNAPSGRPRVRVSTGDYRIEDEHVDSPPPPQGEVVVATPERLDSILRLDENETWLEQVGVVVIDEAHLIGSPRRGPTLEFLVTTLKTAPRPPRLLLLSASFGEPERLVDWLAPCDLVQTKDPVSRLRREVWELQDGAAVDNVLAKAVKESLQQEGSSVLVFVYQRASAERLARALGGAAYHSGMSTAQKGRVRADFLSGQTRCVVTTTALALGVNLPATHVFLRDTMFFGFGRLAAAEILQILGRAGRGDHPGYGVVFVRKHDDWQAAELANDLRHSRLQPIRSALGLSPLVRRSTNRSASTPAETAVVARIVAACLHRKNESGMTREEVARFFEHSLGGRAVSARIPEALRWLEDAARLLAWSDEGGRYRLTALGSHGVRAMLPPELTAGYGQLVRDLLSLDSDDRALSSWTSLDHLIVLELLSERSPLLRRFSDRLVDQVDSWMEECRGEIPLLFREWIRGTEANSKADEVLGSLGLTRTRRESWQVAYSAVFRTIILIERSSGRPADQLSHRFGIPSLEGIEEGWRDAVLWMLHGLAGLCDVRCFYYHLLENCGAGVDRIQRVKTLLRRMRVQAVELQEKLKYCSPLGGTLTGLRIMFSNADGPVAAFGTIKRLEDAGVASLAALMKLSVTDLQRLGVRKDFANQIRTYLRSARADDTPENRLGSEPSLG